MSEQLITPELKDIFKDITYTESRSVDPSIRAIDLGVLGREADEVLSKTLSDPGLPEIIRNIYVTRDGTVLIEKQDKVFYSDYNLIEHVIYYVRMPSTGKEVKAKAIATPLHSHRGFDLPPSPYDIQGLFLDSSKGGAETAAMVVTPASKYLVFRGDDSPYFNQDKLDEKVELWMNNILDRAKGLLRSGISIEDQITLNRRVQMAHLGQLARTYGLRCFTCPLSENVALDIYPRIV